MSCVGERGERHSEFGALAVVAAPSSGAACDHVEYPWCGRSHVHRLVVVAPVVAGAPGSFRRMQLIWWLSSESDRGRNVNEVHGALLIIGTPF